jgi:hypothetical protein
LLEQIKPGRPSSSDLLCSAEAFALVVLDLGIGAAIQA